MNELGLIQHLKKGNRRKDKIPWHVIRVGIVFTKLFPILYLYICVVYMYL